MVFSYQSLWFHEHIRFPKYSHQQQVPRYSQPTTSKSTPISDWCSFLVAFGNHTIFQICYSFSSTVDGFDDKTIKQWQNYNQKCTQNELNEENVGDGKCTRYIEGRVVFENAAGYFKDKCNSFVNIADSAFVITLQHEEWTRKIGTISTQAVYWINCSNVLVA